MADLHLAAEEVTSGNTRTSKSGLTGFSFWVIVAVTSVVQLGGRGWAAYGGWFYWDDFWWHDIVARNSLLETTGLSLGGHLSPLTYIPYWIVTAMAPYDWGVRVLVMLVTLALVNVAVILVVRRLWDDPRPQLAVFVMFAASTLSAPSWLWYSQFSMLGALLLGSTWTLWAFLRACDSRKTKDSVVAVIVLSVSLLAQERMLSLSVVLFSFVLFVARTENFKDTLRNNRGLWRVTSLVLLGYIILYRALVVEAPGSLLPGWADALSIAARTLTTSALPALVGGPWVLDATPVLGRAGTPPLLQVVTCLVMLGLVGLSLRWNKRSWVAWAVLGVGLALDTILVLLGRGATLGDYSIVEWRYFSDLAVLAPLLMVSAFIPPGRRVSLSYPARMILRGCLIVYLAGALLTNVVLGARWHESESRPFVQNALRELEENPQAIVMDRVLPESVVNAVLGPQRLASRVFSIIHPPVIFDRPTARPFWIDDSGTLVPGGLVRARSFGGGDRCDFPLNGTETMVIPVDGGVKAIEWGIALEYRVDRDVTIALSYGPRTELVAVDMGSGLVFVPMQGSDNEIRVFLTAASAQGCVVGVSIGSSGSPGNPFDISRG